MNHFFLFVVFFDELVATADESAVGETETDGAGTEAGTADAAGGRGGRRDGRVEASPKGRALI